jgi:putative component of toxin-antitoxin plasmid stabilization module
MWIQLNMKYELCSTEYFDKWIGKIKDRQTHARILRRLDKLIKGIGGMNHGIEDTAL